MAGELPRMPIRRSSQNGGSASSKSIGCRYVPKTTVLESWIPYRSGSFKGSNLVTSQEPAVRFLLSYDHSLTFGGKIGYLHPFRSTDAPPAAAHHPLTQEVLANGDAVLPKTVHLGGYVLKTDPPSPFREWRRLIGCCQQRAPSHVRGCTAYSLA